MSNNQIHQAATLIASDAKEADAFVASSAIPTPFAEIRQEADPRAVRALSGAAPAAGAPQPELSGTGFTYRHDWGARRGQVVLRLNWDVIQPTSRVLVAVGEGVPGGPGAGKFIGAARYTVHNVAPRFNGVDVWVNIEWSADISLYVDYLIINP